VRRPTSALAKAVLGTALAATTVSAQQPPPVTSPGSVPGGAQDPAAAAPVSPGRGARHLLRNGWDYVTYQQYERALGFFREAETRQVELTDAERLRLRQGIERAQRGLREAANGMTTEPAYARTGARRPGALALAAPAPTQDSRPRYEREPIQLTSGAATAPARAPAPAAATSPAPAALMTPAPIPPTPDVESVALPPLSAEMPAPVEAPKVALRPEPAPAPVPDTAVPVLPSPDPEDADLPALPASPAPAASAPVVAPAPVSAAVPTPARDPAVVPAPAPVAELPPPAAEPAPAPVPVPVPVPEVLPEPASADSVPELPALPAGTSTPPAVEAPPALPAEEVVTPSPTAEAPRPELPDTPPAPSAVPAAPTTVPAPPGTRPRGRFGIDTLLPDAPTTPHVSTLPPETQREVERVAQSMKEEEQRRGQSPAAGAAAGAGSSSGESGTSPGGGSASTRLEISRAPSPTEARPIRAIPVPEEFVPLPKREWDPNRKYWVAAATCHLPLYFQDASLERYGYSVEQHVGPIGRFLSIPLDDPTQSKQRNQIAQPFFSAGLFAAQIALLPYNMLMDPPWEAEYDLGYFRPGDRVPNDVFYLPLTGVGPPLAGKNYGNPPPRGVVASPSRWGAGR